MHGIFSSLRPGLCYICIVLFWQMFCVCVEVQRSLLQSSKQRFKSQRTTAEKRLVRSASLFTDLNCQARDAAINPERCSQQAHGM